MTGWIPIFIDSTSLKLLQPDFWQADLIRAFFDNYENKRYDFPWKDANENFYILDPDPNIHAPDGSNGKFFVQSKDQQGTTSRLSEGLEVIIDISPPYSNGSLELMNHFSEDSTDGWVELIWNRATDSLSGFSHYCIRRMIDDSTFTQIDSTSETNSTDDFSEIGYGTQIYYQIVAYDAIENSGIIAENDVRCLLGPEISSNADTTQENSVDLTLDKFDLRDVTRFQVNNNDSCYDIPNSNPLRIDLLDGKNRIKVRAFFSSINGNTDVYSTWSNIDIVYRTRLPTINWVTVNHDTNSNSMHQGNLIISWDGENLDDFAVKIFRKECEEDDSSEIGLIMEAHTFIDNYCDGVNCIKPFHCYEYCVVPFQIVNNQTLNGQGACSTNYCNRAPEIEWNVVDYIGKQPFDICISENWISKIENANLLFQFEIEYGGSTFTAGWQEIIGSCLNISLQDLIANLSEYNNTKFAFRVQAKTSTGNISAWSLPLEAILDAYPPVPGGDLKLENKIKDDFSDGHIKLNWPPAIDALSGVSHYSILRKISNSPDSNFVELVDILRDTAYDDDFSNIDFGTQIYYQIFTSDLVGNSDTIATGDIRCLLGPEISTEAETTYDRSVELKLDKFDIENVTDFQVNNNGSIYDIGNDIPLIVNLSLDTNIIKIRAFFEHINEKDSLYSIWSNFDSVICLARPRIDTLIVENDMDSATMHEGNMVLIWAGENLDNCSFKISRKKMLDTNFRDVDTTTDSSWIDYYENGGMEPFQYYQYKVNPVLDDEQFAGDSSANYCTRAPELEWNIGEYVGRRQPIDICISNNWMDKIDNSLLTNLMFYLKITHNDTTIIDKAINVTNHCLNFSLNDLIDNLANFNGDSFEFSIQAKTEDNDTSTWSLPLAAILDITPPDGSGSLILVNEINDDRTDGCIKITWPEAQDSLSGLSHYLLSWKKRMKKILIQFPI